MADTERQEFKKEALRRKLPRGSRVYTVRLLSRGHKFVLLCSPEPGRVENITADAREAAGLGRVEAWTKLGYNYNHAASCVEELAMALYGDPSALDWEALNPK